MPHLSYHAFFMCLETMGLCITVLLYVGFSLWWGIKFENLKRSGWESLLIDAAPTLICVAVSVGLPQSTYGVLIYCHVRSSVPHPGQKLIAFDRFWSAICRTDPCLKYTANGCSRSTPITIEWLAPYSDTRHSRRVMPTVDVPYPANDWCRVEVGTGHIDVKYGLSRGVLRACHLTCHADVDIDRWWAPANRCWETGSEHRATLKI